MDKQAVYSPGQAAWGSFLGGPLASVIFVKANYKALGKPDEERQTLIFGALFLVALLCLLPFLPEHFPNMAIPIATIITTRSIVDKYQFTKLSIAESQFYTFQSNWRVVGIALLSLVVYFAAGLSILFGADYLGIVEIS